MKIIFCLFAFVFSFAVVADEVYYIPGWLSTRKPETLAWNSFTNIFENAQCHYWHWDSFTIWPSAVDNADAEVDKLTQHIKLMNEERRSNLILVGHSLGGRIVAKTLAKIADDGIKIKRGILLAPAIPAREANLIKIGGGSIENVLTIINPDDIILKYVYGIMGGESFASYGSSGAPETGENVKEISVAENITQKTKIKEFWGKLDAIKEIANHHVCFYFEELKSVLKGEEVKKSKVLVLQGNVNVECKVVGASIWWDTLDSFNGWRLERHIITRHCRIIDSDNIRKAWGSESEMRQAFDKLKKRN